MNSEEFEKLKQNDPYLKERKRPSDAEVRLLLQEVNFRCPLCGKILQSKYPRKRKTKLFEIAHIYPNSPTLTQYETFRNLEKLGKSSEDFENKIALCKDCHESYDYQTSKEEYLRLVEIKKNLLNKGAISHAIDSIEIEESINLVIQKLLNSNEQEKISLNYSPVPISKKFLKESSSEMLLKTKVSSYVTDYFPYIQKLFSELDGHNGFFFDALSQEIRLCFTKIKNLENNKALIFEQMVCWLQNKTQSDSREACEAVISFFVQNCEIFNEITE